MNILQIIPNKGWGGGEKFVFELSQALITKDINVTVVVPRCSIIESKFRGSGVPTERIDFKGPVDLIGIAKLAKLLKSKDIDIVHVHIFKHASAVILARKLFGADVKIVMTRHLCRPAKQKPRLYKSLDKMIFVSDYARDTFMSTNPAIDTRKITVIHNSIRLDKTTVPFDKQSLPTDRILIGFAGSISSQKGIDMTIDVLHKIKVDERTDFCFCIAGRGKDEYITALKIRIEALQLADNVMFIGFIDDTIGFFEAMDFVVAPSQIVEAGSLSILESMAAGRAAIATDSSQTEQITNMEQGLIIEMNNPSQLRDTILNVLENKTLREELGARAKQRFDREFNYTNFLNRTIDLYTSVVLQ